MTTKRILVSALALMVTRDAMTILPVTVPEHELEIQKAIFGEDNVEIREGQNAQPIAISPDDEAERLVGKYGAGAIEATFGVNFKGKIAKAALEFKVGDAPEEDDAGLGGFDGTGDAGGKITKKGIDKGADADAELLTMTKDELLKYASANSIEGAKPAMTKAQILDEIASANRK